MPERSPRPRRLAPLAAVLVAAALAAGAVALLSGPLGRPDEAGGVSIGGPFALTDGAGRTVTERSFPDRWLLVYFGYTFCPDACPTTLNEIAGALKALGPKAARLQALFITVDPARDTPDIMAKYAAAFDSRIIGLTGSADQVAQAERAYHVYAQKQPNESDPGGYLMDHSSILYLMDPQGRLAAPLAADLPAAALAKQLSDRIS